MKPCAPRRTYIPALAPTTCLEVYYSDCRWPDWTPCEDPGWNPQYRVTQDWAWRERALRAAATRSCTAYRGYDDWLATACTQSCVVYACTHYRPHECAAYSARCAP